MTPKASRRTTLFVLGGVLVVLMALLGLPKTPRPVPVAPSNPPIVAPSATTASPGPLPGGIGAPPLTASSEPSPEQIVAAKVAAFAESRRMYAHKLAERHGVEIPVEVERFFDAVHSGDWEAIEAAFQTIHGGDSSSSVSNRRAPELLPIWPAIIDAYGVAEQAHEWPAEQLLTYGNTILQSLRPGMVYVGGTDNGRWIPELLGETSDGEHPMVITQNGLADATYLDYVNLLYDDRLATLNSEDSSRAFTDYIADARKRLEHDQQHPEEPKQIRSGEDIQITDGRVQVSGQVAVMAINERLLVALMEKNPDLSFGLQESFPLNGAYADALPLGALMELSARDDQNTFTSERAAQYLAQWQTTAEQALDSPEETRTPAVMKSWSHDANSAGNLLAAHNFTAEAEQAYGLSRQLWPGNPEPTAALADVMERSGRADEARKLLLEFERQYPDQSAHLKTADSWKALMGKEAR